MPWTKRRILNELPGLIEAQRAHEAMCKWQQAPANSTEKNVLAVYDHHARLRRVLSLLGTRNKAIARIAAEKLREAFP